MPNESNETRLLALATFLLFFLAGAVQLGYIPVSLLGGLTGQALGVFGALAFIATLASYYWSQPDGRRSFRR